MIRLSTEIYIVLLPTEKITYRPSVITQHHATTIESHSYRKCDDHIARNNIYKSTRSFHSCDFYALRNDIISSYCVYYVLNKNNKNRFRRFITIGNRCEFSRLLPIVVAVFIKFSTLSKLRGFHLRSKVPSTHTHDRRTYTFVS